MIDDPEEANKLFNKIKEHLPEIFQYRKLVGVNERLRFLKYDVGNFFKKHMDGAFTRVETGERSLFTVMLYLNGDMAGGTTRIYGQVRQTLHDLIRLIHFSLIRKSLHLTYRLIHVS